MFNWEHLEAQIASGIDSKHYLGSGIATTHSLEVVLTPQPHPPSFWFCKVVSQLFKHISILLGLPVA